MFNIIIKTVIIYFSVTVVMRLVGKTQAAELQPYEFVITLMIAEVATTPMNDPGTPILYGLVPASCLLLLYYLFSYVTLKSKIFRALLCGKPSIIIQNGTLNQAEIKKTRYSLNDLMEQLRLSGYTSIPDIHYAILETNGELSVLPYTKYTPVTPSMMDLDVTKEDMDFALILDGKLQNDYLPQFGLEHQSVKKLLHSLGFNDAKDIYMFTLSNTGNVFIQDKTGKSKNTHLTGITLQ